MQKNYTDRRISDKIKCDFLCSLTYINLKGRTPFKFTSYYKLMVNYSCAAVFKNKKKVS